MGEFWSKMSYRQYRRFTYCSYYVDVSEVRGLFNYSLSCCVNSLLQSFSATTELLDILNKWCPSEEIEQSNIPQRLKNALLAMRDKSHPAPHKDFLDSLYRHAIRRGTQQDADEIFHIILNLIQKQISDLGLAQEIRSLYEIKVETQVQCSHCSFIQREPNSLFSLPLAISEKENTLESCINSFFQSQNLVNGDKYHCNQCEQKQPSTHGLKLVSLPLILCVHLKRFRNDRGVTRKLDSKVTFPDYFKSGIFAAGQPENVANDSPRADEHYSLYAVIVHIGSAMFGHYTAYIRPVQEDQTWYYADDCSVRPAKWADVQSTYEGSNAAYLLLYRKKSCNSSG
ncbi:ubl carboxyl-terminal hydrolase 18 isoform X1 [Pimephales promelas]|uniref:ubl carboxyl-terminal hydrolase 18 isoform X1 n=1 Tax=Pimephales promelas TaxID=90988 RepID=UPI001955EE40|nr:ubl carboxyl-terminal hydrolase 18 isoform X1 [Pimephales promelas]XP_039523729.1 ubl carboxyl-terminal hydrolase 18 isoform X1 [Pimephales promelas]